MSDYQVTAYSSPWDFTDITSLPVMMDAITSGPVFTARPVYANQLVGCRMYYREPNNVVEKYVVLTSNTGGGLSQEVLISWSSPITIDPVYGVRIVGSAIWQSEEAEALSGSYLILPEPST